MNKRINPREAFNMDLPEKIIEAVQWYEGMLLSPQHFQQLCLRNDQLNKYYLKTACPFYWGVSRFIIDEVLLVNGRLRVLQLEALLPDGTIVVLPPSTGETSLEIDLTKHQASLAQGPATLHLILPAYQDNQSSVLNDYPRYISIEGEPTIDDNTGEGNVQIPRLRPKIDLYLGEEVPGRYISLPLAKVVYQNDAYAFVDFVPPVLEINKNDALGSLVMDMAKRLREKAAYLSDKVQSSNFSAAVNLNDHSADTLAMLVAHLPYFESVLFAPITHPFLLYMALCGLAGQVAAIRPGQLPPVFKPYDHNNLWETYSQVVSFIIKMLNLIHESYTPYQFAFKQGVFSLQIQPSWISDKFIIGVKGSVEMSRQEVINWVKSAIIVSEDNVKAARDKRILGASREVIDGVDANLFPGKDIILAEVQKTALFINLQNPLQVFNFSNANIEEKQPVEVYLYVQNDTQKSPMGDPE